MIGESINSAYCRIITLYKNSRVRYDESAKQHIPLRKRNRYVILVGLSMGFED